MKKDSQNQDNDMDDLMQNDDFMNDFMGEKKESKELGNKINELIQNHSPGGILCAFSYNLFSIMKSVDIPDQEIAPFLRDILTQLGEFYINGYTKYYSQEDK